MWNGNSMVAADLKLGNEEFQVRFVVPIYQRVFTWGEREVARLLSDLYDHFVKEEKKEPYYLGVITVVDGGTSQHCSDLILVDGQQRLTCIMLLGALLGWGLDIGKLNYEARPMDQRAKELIDKYASGGGDWTNCPDFGNKAMNAFFRCAFDHKDKVDELRKNAEIPNQLKLFISKLPRNPYKKNLEEQNKYFEKMNSGGQQLEPHEILKVKIGGKSTLEHAFEEWNKAIDFSQAYQSVEKFHDDKPFEFCFEDAFFAEPGNDVDEGSMDEDEDYLPGRAGLVTPSIFLLHVRALVDNDGKLDPQWREDKLLESFSLEVVKDWADHFIEKMVEYRKFLDERIVHLSFDTGKNAHDYKFEDDEEDAERNPAMLLDKEKLRQFQSMLYVSSQGRQGRQEWLLEAFKLIQKEDDYKSFLNKLKEIDRRLSDTDGHLSASYVDELKYADQSRWLFWRLDYLLWECVMSGQKIFSTNEDDNDQWDGSLSTQETTLIKSYRFHIGRSIEHLHPQTDDGNEAWNKTIEDGKTPKKDMFYNLCLLTQSWNSTLGKDTVKVKLAKVEELINSGKSGLQSIKMLFMFKECEGNDSRWTPGTALIHLERMKKVLMASYLYHRRQFNINEYCRMCAGYVGD